jgi:hypothetical protein
MTTESKAHETQPGAAAKTPSLRLPLGSDTVARIESKHAFVEKELAEWRDVATSTDFAKGTA